MTAAQLRAAAAAAETHAELSELFADAIGLECVDLADLQPAGPIEAARAAVLALADDLEP